MERKVLRMKYVALLTLSVLLLGIVAACGGGGAPAASPQPGATPTKAAATTPASKAGDPQKGKELITSKGCIACHIIQGVPGAVGTVGPDLSKVASAQTIAGGKLTPTEDNLKKWLKNPPGVKSDTLMPNLGLTDTEVSNLVAYLLTLK